MDAEYLSSMLDGFREQPFYLYRVKKKLLLQHHVQQILLAIEYCRGQPRDSGVPSMASVDLLTDSLSFLPKNVLDRLEKVVEEVQRYSLVEIKEI